MRRRNQRAPTVPLVVVLFTVACMLPIQAHSQRSPADSASVLLRVALGAYRHGSRESLAQSIRLFQQALPQLRIAGDRAAESNALIGAGMAHQALGHADSSLVYYAQALAIDRELGNRAAEGMTLRSIGTAHLDPQ